MLQHLDEFDNRAKDPAHRAIQPLIRFEATGGRPRKVIDPDFLRESLNMRESSGIGRLIGVSGRTVRRNAIRWGLASAAAPVLITTHDESTGEVTRVHNEHSVGRQPRSSLTESELDRLICNVLQQFPNHGRLMISGQLASFGHYVTMHDIRASVRRVYGMPAQFGRQQIARREYRVAGPDSLWHHDGQHGERTLRRTPSL